jgi:PAS domain S-box-containing protein
MIGYRSEEVLGKAPYDLMSSEEAKRAMGLLYGVALETKPFHLFECTLLHKDGHTVNVEISGDPIFTSSGDFIGYRGITRDVTQRNKDKYELSVANRSLRLLSDCNRALIQSTDERALLTDICHILVETGEYRLAWVGYKEMDAEKRIIPVADAGNDTGYVDTIKLSWSDESPGGMGPGGMAIRNCSPFILRWDGLEGQFVSWRKEALDRGMTSIIGLPLMENGQAFGVLLIYSGRMDAFNDAEVEMLKELSDNVSYSVSAIRARTKQ